MDNSTSPQAQGLWTESRGVTHSKGTSFEGKIERKKAKEKALAGKTHALNARAGKSSARNARKGH